MFDFVYNQILFYVAVILVLFLPGYFLLLMIESDRRWFAPLEKVVIACGLSTVVVNFLLLIAGRLEIFISRISTLGIIFFFCLLCLIINKVRINRRFETNKQSTGITSKDQAFSFSSKQVTLVVVILFLTIFIKTIYLSKSIFPTSTDLGHHMYWSKQIVETGKIPTYEKIEIIETDGNYQISPPKPIADFIIGEHLIFAAIALIAGADFVSAFPSLILLLINVFSLLTVFILTARIFADTPEGKNIALLSFFFLGPLYAVSAPQAKFVSGGVVGNLLGNLLIPLVIYFFYRSLSKNNSNFALLGILTATGVFYTHHLSALIMIFIMLFSFALFLIFNAKNAMIHLKNWLHLITSPPVWSTIVLIIIFVSFVYVPDYFEKDAIQTAIGSPSKPTRAGLTFEQLKFSAGEPRMVMGLAGILLIALARKRNIYGSSLLLGWTIALMIMSLFPAWLFINIPSNRVASYISFPLTILSAYALIHVIKMARQSGAISHSFFLPAFFFLFFTFFVTSGLYDNSKSLVSKSNSSLAIQTFHVSDYLAKKTDKEDLIVKDHNYITADAWMKLYFMRDYNFPLSRGFFKRYEDKTKPREMCTLWMLSTPGLKQGQKCYHDLGVNFSVVNYHYDSTQFKKNPNFNQVYAGESIIVYYRNF